MARVAVETPVGLPPARDLAKSDSSASSDRDSSSAGPVSATQRHRQWLNSFAASRRSMRAALLREARRIQQQREHLAAKLKDQRDQIRGIKESNQEQNEKNKKIEALFGGNQDNREENNGESAAQPEPIPVPEPSAAAKSSKPSWARTAAEESAHLDAEAADLLSFTATLDYDSIIDDIEVREALRFVQDRVKHLEIEEKQKEKEEFMLAQREIINKLREARELERAAIRANQGQTEASRESDRAPKSVHSQSQSDGDGDGNGVSEAREILERNAKLKQIHSTNSVKAIIEREKDRDHLALTNSSSSAVSLAVCPPLISVTHERSSLVSHQQLIAQSKQPDPLNLPYLYRHPAI